MGRPTTLPSPWLELADAAGGVGKLAALLGVSPMTVWRWAYGHASMSGPARIAVAMVSRDLGVLFRM